MSDYRVIVKVQNGRIWEAIRSKGFKNIAQFCKANSLNQTSLGEILNLKSSPTYKRTNNFRSIVIRLADALNCIPEELFTERQYEAVPSNVKDFLIEEQHMTQLMSLDSSSPENRLALIEMASGIQERANLSKRQSLVIEMRFRQDKSYEEIAKTLDVTRERVRHIEATALRKMRHPSALADVLPTDIHN